MVKFLESLFNAARERVRNPIVPAFVISWCLLNFKRLFVLFASTKHAEDRIADFDRDWLTELLLTASALAIAAAYVELMPKLVLFIQRRQAEPQKTARIEKTQIERAVAQEEFETEELKQKTRDIREMASAKELLAELTDRVERLESSTPSTSESVEQAPESNSHETVEFSGVESAEWQNHFRALVTNRGNEQVVVSAQLVRSTPQIDQLPVPLNIRHHGNERRFEPGEQGAIDLLHVTLDPATSRTKARLLGAMEAQLFVKYQTYELVVRLFRSNADPIDQSFLFEADGNKSGTLELLS